MQYTRWTLRLVRITGPGLFPGPTQLLCGLINTSPHLQDTYWETLEKTFILSDFQWSSREETPIFPCHVPKRQWQADGPLANPGKIKQHSQLTLRTSGILSIKIVLKCRRMWQWFTSLPGTKPTGKFPLSHCCDARGLGRVSGKGPPGRTFICKDLETFYWEQISKQDWQWGMFFF